MAKHQDESVSELRELISLAEKSVSEIKDDALRSTGFQTILQHLLAQGKPSASKGAQKGKRSNRSSSSKESNQKAKASGPKAWLEELHEEDFFDEPRSSKDILEELSSRSHHLQASDLTRPLEALCHDHKLRRRKQDASDGGKRVFHWSNW